MTKEGLLENRIENQLEEWQSDLVGRELACARGNLWRVEAAEIIQGLDKLLLHVSTRHGYKYYLFHSTNEKEAKNYIIFRGIQNGKNERDPLVGRPCEMPCNKNEISANLLMIYNIDIITYLMAHNFG